MRAPASVLLLAMLAGGVAGRASAQVAPDFQQQSTQQSTQQSSEPPGAMRGRVVDFVTGEPVRGATVNLVNYTHGGNSILTRSDGSGAFAALKLSPGDYLVQANHPNYQGIMGMPSPSQIVNVASDQETTDVTVKLIPGGSISGKVIDDGGQAVTGCSIYALAPRPEAGSGAYGFRGSATTDDQGEYRLDTLTADRYLVYARCQESLPVERLLAVWRPEQIQPAKSWLPVYYPGNPSMEGAQPLAVLPGGALTGIDFHLRETPVTTVSGTIGGFAPGAPGGQPNIMLVPEGASVDPSLGYGAGFDAAASRFQVQMVPPGSYRLMVISSPGQIESLAYASASVNVGPARPAPLAVQLRPGLTLTGVVEQPPAGSGDGVAPVALNSLQGPGRQTPKEAPIGTLQLIPLSQTPLSTLRQAEVHRDGTFSAQGLTPGRYRVAPQVWGSATHGAGVDSVRRVGSDRRRNRVGRRPVGDLARADGESVSGQRQHGRCTGGLAGRLGGLGYSRRSAGKPGFTIRGGSRREWKRVTAAKPEPGQVHVHWSRGECDGRNAG